MRTSRRVRIAAERDQADHLRILSSVRLEGRTLSALLKEHELLRLSKALVRHEYEPGATVIDVGVNRIPDTSSPRGYRLVGDVDFASVQPVAGAITPNPGGVGPMTIALLLSNTLRAAEDTVS